MPPEGTPLDPRRAGEDQPVQPPTPRLKRATAGMDPRSAPAEAQSYGPLMTLPRFKDRFLYFSNLPQQQKGVGILYDEILAMPGGRTLLSEDALWATEYSNTPEPPPAPPKPVFSNPLNVRFQSQLDNSHEPHRECFLSSCAMAAMFWGKVKDDEEYGRLLRQQGDTTDSSAQVRTLRALGLQADFIQNGSVQWLENQIRIGRPTPVGWLHHGPVSAPSGGGHWTCCIGDTPTHWIHHDPFGVADMVDGGYTANTNGASVQYTRANWERRWLVYSANDGWAVDIRP